MISVIVGFLFVCFLFSKICTLNFALSVH